MAVLLFLQFVLALVVVVVVVPVPVVLLLVFVVVVAVVVGQELIVFVVEVLDLLFLEELVERLQDPKGELGCVILEAFPSCSPGVLFFALF